MNNLTGQRFGWLTVTAFQSGSRSKRLMWLCLCDCGNEKWISGKDLKDRVNKTCGCHKANDSKICAMCKLDKPRSEYHKGGNSSGMQSKCKPCMTKFKKDRYWRNRDIELAKLTKSRSKPENVLQRKGYYESNKDEYKKRYKKYMADDSKKQRKKEVSIKYRKESAEKISAYKKAYYQREDFKIRRREKHRRQQQSDLVYIIKRRLRFRLRSIFRRLGLDNKYKKMSSIALLGCDMDFFKKHIEGKFTDGMSWERISEIHLDHIKPCARFDLTNIEEQKKCFHWSNIQPLWKLDNMKKGFSYQEE